MENNLFVDAMDTNQWQSIQEIKLNKAFARQLINDLDKVFQTNYQIEDLENGVCITIRTSASSSNYGSFRFIVSKDGIKFRSSSMGYYNSIQSYIMPLGALYEKYKEHGTTADAGFLTHERRAHGKVEFSIPINRNGDNLKESLRDIMYLLEQNQYKKRF